MSLIDDALKRAQEASRREGEKEPARPWTPAPLPDAGLARRRAALRATGRALAAIGGFAVLVFLGRMVWNAAAPEAPRAPRAAALAVPTPAPTLPETVVPSPVPAAVASDAAPVPPRPARAPQPPPPSVAAEGGDSTSRPPERPAASASRGLADGRTYIGAVELPEGGRIELGGIVWSEVEPRVLLNDRIVATGGYVEGFTVSKIDENRVILVRDGMTIYLAVK
jgi:hypothetical protein